MNGVSKKQTIIQQIGKTASVPLRKAVNAYLLYYGNHEALKAAAKDLETLEIRAHHGYGSHPIQAATDFHLNGCKHPLPLRQKLMVQYLELSCEILF